MRRDCTKKNLNKERKKRPLDLLSFLLLIKFLGYLKTVFPLQTHSTMTGKSDMKGQTITLLIIS